MARVKYLGGLGAEYMNYYALMPIGGEAEMPDHVIAVMLKDFPGCFERVDPDTRAADAPPQNRMKRKAEGKRDQT